MSWIDVEDYENFIYDTLEINDYYSKKNINISFEPKSHSYNISKKVMLITMKLLLLSMVQNV